MKFSPRFVALLFVLAGLFCVPLPYPGSIAWADNAPTGVQVDLSRADRDKPGDTEFTLTGPKFTQQLLSEALNAQNLPETLKRLNPSTDDPTIRNVSLQVKDGQQISIQFEKKVMFGYWAPVTITGTTEVTPATCPDAPGAPGANQVGYQVLFDTSGTTAAETQKYVNGIKILICAAVDSGSNSLTVQVHRYLYQGEKYEPWIALLLGDFMRPTASALQQSLEAMAN